MKRCLLIAAAACLSFMAGASTNDLLSWEECLSRAKANSPELVAARAAVRELEYGVASASAGFLPQVDASASFTKRGTENDAGWTESDSTGAGVGLTQDLFSGGNNLARRRRAQAQLEVGREQYRETLAAVELRLRQAFIETVYAQELIRLTEQIAERRANNVRLIQLRFDGGRENAGSLARSKAQLAQAEYEVREARRALRYARRTLAAAMGSMDSDFGVTGDLAAQVPGGEPGLEDLMRQTPAYLIAETQIEASRQGVRIERSDRFPSVTFNAGAGLSGDRDLEFGSWNVGLRASVDLFTGNRNRSNVAAAKERLVQTEMDFLDTANTLLANLQQRWNSYVDAVENVETQRQSLEAEMLRAEISTAKYKQGLLSFEDWDIIESNVINQGKTHLQRRRVAELEQARWKNVLGWSNWQEKQGE
jgi:outer membrane protein TolC